MQRFCLTAPRTTDRTPPLLFQRPQATADITFGCRQGLDQVGMATGEYPFGTLLVRDLPTQYMLVQSG